MLTSKFIELLEDNELLNIYGLFTENKIKDVDDMIKYIGITDIVDNESILYEELKNTYYLYYRLRSRFISLETSEDEEEVKEIVDKLKFDEFLFNTQVNCMRK